MALDRARLISHVSRIRKIALPHIFRVIAPVDDIDRATHFYGALLGEPGRRISPGRDDFDCEGTILACYAPDADGDARTARPPPEPIYIAVDDLESTSSHAKAA